MSMSAEEWNPLIYGPKSAVRKVLRRLRLLPLVSRGAGVVLGARNALGLEGALPITRHDRLTRNLRAILDRSAEFLSELGRVPIKGRILFPHLRGHPYLELLEIFLAYRLWLDGYEPVFVACGGLPVCNNYTLGEDAARNPQVCRTCVRNHDQLLRASGVPYRDIVTSPAAIGEALSRTRRLSVQACHEFVYRGVPVGELVVPSVARHLRRTALFASEPDEVDAWRAYVASACVLVDRLSELLDEVRPARGLMAGGWFMWYAIASHLLRQRNVESVFYEAGFHDAPKGHRWVFSQGVPLTDPGWIAESWREWRDVPLTAEENAHLDQVLAARRRGSVYHPSPLEDAAAIRRELQLPDDGRPVVALFTGLTWDYAIYGRGRAAFSDMTDWVVQTIRCMADRDAWVVIRIHPAEAILHEGVYGRENLAELLRARLGELPGNVRLVPARSKVSSYRLLEMADAAVVFASTIGLEAAIAARSPLILGAYSILSDRGFGRQPETPSAYYDLLADVRSLPRPRPEEAEAARRFTYLYFFRTSWPLHFYDSGADGIYSIDRFRIRTLDELRPGSNRLLDRLVAGIHGNGALAMPREL